MNPPEPVTPPAVSPVGPLSALGRIEGRVTIRNPDLGPSSALPGADARTPDSPHQIRTVESELTGVVGVTCSCLWRGTIHANREAADNEHREHVKREREGFALPHSPHPATAAVLAAMPIDPVDGKVITSYVDRRFANVGPPEPLAATYAAAVLREHARWLAIAGHPDAAHLTRYRADEIESPKGNNR